jgi:hypothetical protein
MVIVWVMMLHHSVIGSGLRLTGVAGQSVSSRVGQVSRRKQRGAGYVGWLLVRLVTPDQEPATQAQREWHV